MEVVAKGRVDKGALPLGVEVGRRRGRQAIVAGRATRTVKAVNSQSSFLSILDGSKTIFGDRIILSFGSDVRSQPIIPVMQLDISGM